MSRQGKVRTFDLLPPTQTKTVLRRIKGLRVHGHIRTYSGALQKSQQKSKAACKCSLWSGPRTILGSLLKLPNAAPPGKTWAWVTLKLTLAGHAAGVNPSTPTDYRSLEEMDPITQARSSL